jgi:O-antigen ligase
MNLQSLKRIYLYILVVILTISTEDTFLLIRLSNEGRSFLFDDLFASIEPIFGILLLTIVFAFLSISYPPNKVITILNSILITAILFGITIGIIRGDILYTALFEFRYWRSLVFFSALTVVMFGLWQNKENLNQFINWFVIIQALFALYSLGNYILFGNGQLTNYARRVPVFAGDELHFLVLAYFLLSVRNIKKPGWFSILQQGLIFLVLVFSLRRAILAAVIAGVLLPFGVNFFKKTTISFKKILSYLSISLILFGFFLLIIDATTDIEYDYIFYRFETINPFANRRYAHDTTKGHTDDFLDGWELVKQSPIVGKGLDSYFELIRTEDWQGHSSLHSTMFSLWVKMGLPGLLFYLFVITYGLRFILSFHQSLTDDQYWFSVFVFSFSAYNFLATIYTNGIFLGWKNAFCLAIYMSICIYLSNLGIANRVDSAKYSSENRMRLEKRIVIQ